MGPTHTQLHRLVAAPLVGGMLVGVLLALLAKDMLALGDWYLVKVLSGLALVGWLVTRATRRGSGHRGHFGLANQVTLARAILVIVLLGLLGESADIQVMWSAVIIASVALASDALDGWLARRTGTVSDFGARFDMETDAALVAVLALLAWWWERAGMWVLLAGVARYVFAAGVCCCHWMRRELPPSLRRKAVCVVQLVALVLCVAPLLPESLSALCAALGVGALLGSFAIDTLWLARAAHADPKGVLRHVDQR